MDAPNARSSHSTVTPKGGGIGLLAALLAAWAWLDLPAGFVLPAAGISVLSLVDDRIHLPAKARLVLHLLLALALLVGVPVVSADTWQGLVLLPFGMLLLAGTANFYNFMDGINGIAGLTGVVGFSLLGATAQGSLAGLCFGLAAACLGFLPFNLPKARVFMGDVGSVLLGFLFAALALLSAEDLAGFICRLGFLFPFYADELTTMAVRLSNGENLLQAHRRHLYQLLANQGGIPHWKVAAGYALLQLGIGTLALTLRPQGPAVLALLFGTGLAGFAYVHYQVRQRLEASTDIS
jgi:Fuc2NAc and GlcNAc transferase